MKTKFTIVFLSVLIIGFSACETNDDSDQIICTTQYVYGLNVTLKDANTSAIITKGITIKATDGNYEETLMDIESSNSFSGAGERTGTYILTINSTNYQNYISEPIIVYRDECHVITEVLEIMLQPN